MKPIAEQLPIDQILAELTKDKLLRLTNNGNNEVYIFDNNTSPALMHEVGRVREITFRHAGGGTDKDLDIDEFDLDTKILRNSLLSGILKTGKWLGVTGIISLRKDATTVTLRSLLPPHISVSLKNSIKSISPI